MRIRAHAKVNLALQVGARRDDGFHELQTIFQTVDLADELSAEADDALGLEVVGLAPPGDDNLVLVAARALATAAGVRAGARLRLRKRIPAGGGLGGGSSDAAAALLLLDRLWGTRASPLELHRLAAEIGSDVPYFLLGGTALGLGRGERLFAIQELPTRVAVLVLPAAPIATGAAFAALDAGGHRPAAPCEGWPYPALWGWGEDAFGGLANDFEATIFAAHAELGRIKQALVAAGAEHALLSGTGSTVFGLFGEQVAAEAAARAQRNPVRVVATLDRPGLAADRWVCCGAG